MYESQEISSHSGVKILVRAQDPGSESGVLSLNDEACVRCQIKATLLNTRRVSR